MQGGKIVYPKKRGLRQEHKELAAKGSYSIILIVLTLFLVRPLMVTQMLSRAEAYSAFGLYDESKRQCNKALLFDGDNSRAWCQLARIHKAEGDLDMALAAYQKAAEADPTNKAAHYELAMLYAQDKCYEQAIPYFEQVRSLGPDNGDRLQQDGFSHHKSALTMLIMCYEKVGDTTKAQFTREEMRVFYPDCTVSDQPQVQPDESQED
jgi:tetratricopeptide (TPR) repeat protein